MSSKGLSLGWLGVAPKKWNKAASNFFTGTPEKREQVSTLLPEQQPLLQQGINAGLAPGAGGAFGDAADYYRGNLGNNPEDFNSFAAPDIRRFNEETIPQLSEQFAGMGSGGLSSSGFRNSAFNAGTDLSERLAQIRSNLRQNSAAGLQNIGQIGLGNFSQNMVTQQGTPGFLGTIAPAIGTAAGAYFGGPAGAQAGNFLGNQFSNSSTNFSNQPLSQGNPVGANNARGLGQNSFGANKVGLNAGPYNQGGIAASPQFSR
jgi:hypothetical protein